jgi:hypothetical protein
MRTGAKNGDRPLCPHFSRTLASCEMAGYFFGGGIALPRFVEKPPSLM